MKQIAEEVSAMNPQESDEIAAVEEVQIPDLSGVVGFSYEDVLHNSAGRQSPAQRRQERARIWRDVISLGVLAGFAVGTYVAGFRIGPLLFLIFFTAGAIKTFVDAQDSLAGDVLQQDGDIWTQLDRGSESPDRYYVHVGGWKLEITKEDYQALIPGGPYRIFYIAGPNRAVGGQVLPGWRALAPPKLEKKSWWKSLSIELG